MAYEDYTTYSQTNDSGGDLTIIATRIDWNTMDETENTYVRENKGANHFGDFEHLVDTQITNIASGVVIYSSFWGLSSNLTSYTMNDKDTNNDGFEVYFSGRTIGGIYFYTVKEYLGNTTDSYVGVKYTKYYLTIERSGTTLTVKIYTDGARTVLVDTLSLNVTSDKMQYINAMSSRDTGNLFDSTGYVENLDLQETPAPTGNKQIPNYFNADFLPCDK